MRLAATLSIFAEQELGRPLFHHPKNVKTVAVDFDGTICDSKGPYMKDHFGKPFPEAFELLRMLKARGIDVVIMTARKETDMVAKWLADHGFPNMFVTNAKIPAQAYLDDRGVHVHWKNQTAKDVMRELLKRPGR